ncbi:MAG TPA: hypothetical protein VGF84_14355 [Micromonosporaceae bacterium]|jgi:hypothetical protein
MAKLGWVGSVALAAGASAGAAAAQFGLGYGLGIISWTPQPSTGAQTTDSVWVAGLAWTAFIATTSTVVGAICADRRSAGEIGAAPPKFGTTAQAPPSVFASAIWRVLLAVAAAVGALLSVALVLVPARAAARPDTSTPQLTAASYAIIGIVAGIVIAVFALIARAGATNVVATAGWLWLLAIATVIDGVVAGRGLGTAPLGVWPFNTNTHAPIWSQPAALSMLAAAFVIGAVVAWAAARRGDSRSGTALSGLFGPLLVLVAYDLTDPLAGVNDSQMSAYVFAGQAFIAGLFGSMLVVGIISARAQAKASADARSSTEFRPPSDPTGALTPPRLDKPVPAVGRARPFRRFRGQQAVVPPTASEAVTVPKPVAVPKPSAGEADSDELATSAASTSTTTEAKPSPKPSEGKRGRR